VSNGVDALGFIVNVPESPRNLTIEEAIALIKETPIFIDTVIVTVTKELKQLKEICRRLSPNYVQVHDADRLHLRKEALPGVKVIKAIYSSSVKEDVLEQAKLFDAILVDTKVKGKLGGTGKTHNWSESRIFRCAIHPKPLILAGGLTSKNIIEAIQTVNPYAVDVSSGVEKSPGVKDAKQISLFMEKVKEADSY
jgi:phosphoribosylanthranilate isomerase